jgi:hypothetical protein
VVATINALSAFILGWSRPLRQAQCTEKHLPWLPLLPSSISGVLVTHGYIAAGWLKSPLGSHLPYRLASTSSWLSTLVTPATCLALASMAAFSWALFTGPRSVTLPFEVMILALWALVDSESSATTALRMFAEISRSAGFSA